MGFDLSDLDRKFQAFALQQSYSSGEGAVCVVQGLVVICILECGLPVGPVFGC
jgi:hypothetical protein